MKKTVRDLLIGVDEDYMVETKYLLRYVLNMTAAQLIMNNNYVLTKNELTRYKELYHKWRKDYFPLSYVIGCREFYSRDFKVTKDTLVPRPETELLVDDVLARAKPGARVLDLGTGTGIIAITCKLERPDLTIIAVDKFPETLAIAKENAHNLGAAVEFLLSDWFSNINGMFDIVVANPPYVAITSEYLPSLKHEPLHALTDFYDGLAHYRKIVAGVNKHIKEEGFLLFEHGAGQGGEIGDIMFDNGFREVETIDDYAGLERMTVGIYRPSDTEF